MRKLKWLFIIIIVLAIVYLAGPSPKTPEYKKDMPPVPGEATALEQYIKSNEAKHKLKKDNEARIVWANDSLKNRTEYSIVYLHGFSASQAEGEPIHRNIAKMFNSNLYLSRLAEHGIDTAAPMLNLTADEYWESAKQAFAIGKQLGKKIILFGTSTGGSNALQLAAAYPNDIAAIILLSPNIKIFDDNAWVLNKPWGLQLARMINGSDYIAAADDKPLSKQYWNAPYRLEAAVALEEMIESSMTEETFKKITQPTLLLYYYRDEIHQDSTVKVSAMKQMFDEIKTPADKKRAVAMPKTGNHVIGSYIRSNDVEGVQKEIESFLSSVVGLKPE
jgi:pimeloyl-ACP methyl ester carboxylesterase